VTHDELLATLANRDQRIAELEQECDAAQRELAIARERISKLEALVADLMKQVADLTQKLGQNSRNSNNPPSQDPPGLPPKSKKEKSKKKRGGQPGHQGHHRKLVAPDQVTLVVDLYPEACEQCTAKLEKIEDTMPTRTQSVELRVQADVTEFRQHEVCCHQCGHKNRAKDENGIIPASPFGPQLMAAVAMLTGVYTISRRKAMRLLHDLTGVKLSLGAVSAIENRVSNAVRGPVEEACERILAAPIKHTDGTSWSQSGVACALWTIASTMATVFRVIKTSSRDVLASLFGPTIGILVSDRAGALAFWAIERRQICWAHLLRKFIWYSEQAEPIAAIGRELLDCLRITFEYWHAFKIGQSTRDELKLRMAAVKQQVKDVLLRGVSLNIRGLSKSCKNILAHEPALWTFLQVEGVEPTNNHAEQALRGAVIWRKTSFGSQSERGDRFVERLLSVAHTAKKQGRQVFEYLTQCCRAKLAGLEPPSIFAT
jgi:transposase